MKRTQALDNTFVLFLAGIAQKLQSDVPGCGRLPAKAVSSRVKPHRGRTELVDHRSGQGDSDKEAHGDYLGSSLEGFGSVACMNSAR